MSLCRGVCGLLDRSISRTVKGRDGLTAFQPAYPPSLVLEPFLQHGERVLCMDQEGAAHRDIARWDLRGQ